MLSRVRKLTPQILSMEKANISDEEIEKFAYAHGITVSFGTIKVMMKMCW